MNCSISKKCLFYILFCLLALFILAACSIPLLRAVEKQEAIEAEEDRPAFVDVLPNMAVSSIFPSDYSYGPLAVLNKNAGNKLIVLDPGHGGVDVGSVYRLGSPDEFYEKDIDLALGLRLKMFLESAGATVYMIRTTDTYINHHDRGAIANAVNGDFFISLHNNSSDHPSVHGTEVWYYDKVDNNGRSLHDIYGISSKTIAFAIQQELLAALGTFDRQLRTDPEMAVLCNTLMPAVVIEAAYISNPLDLEKIIAEEYVDIYAYAVAKALIYLLNESFPEEE